MTAGSYVVCWALLLIMWVTVGGGIVGADEKPKRPPMPLINAPLLFNTKQADAVMASLQLFPATSAWHEDISKLPVQPNSTRMIEGIGANKNLAWNLDMGFVIVPGNQKKIAVKLVLYPDESDPGPYPMPDNAPIEGWPLMGGDLANVQRVGGGDRHVIVLDPVNGRLFEFYQGRRTDGGWQAACAAVFDITSNKLRPPGWTSSDAAGLPILPAVVRYDECERGFIDHALRFTVRRTRKSYLYPATHQAGRTTEIDVPAMGERFRLKAGVDVSHFPPYARAIAQALKTYGMLVADNGGDWRISVAPDDRIQGLDALRALKGSDFEVVQSTGEKAGPRAGR